MLRAPRFAVAVLLLVSLVGAHGSGSLVRTLADENDGTYCCCPSPEECHCTANCCHHGPAGQAKDTDHDDGRAGLRSSVSCHFPALPNGSLTAATGHDRAPATMARAVQSPAPPAASGRRASLDVPSQGNILGPSASPRAPPTSAWTWCRNT